MTAHPDVARGLTYLGLLLLPVTLLLGLALADWFPREADPTTIVRRRGTVAFVVLVLPLLGLRLSPREDPYLYYNTVASAPRPANASPKPVVFTGAMRSASDLGWDGPANLLDAVSVAAAPEAEGLGTVVVMGGRLFAGLEDAKTHTHDLAAFGQLPECTR